MRFRTGVSQAQRRAARSGAGVDFEKVVEGLPGAQVVAVEGRVGSAVARLERQPGVSYAQPNFRYRALAPAPDDSFFGELWGLDDPALPDPGVNALQAWDASLGAGQVIAVVDTGVDLTHPDIAPNLWENPDEDPGDEDLHGYDFVDDDGDPDDYGFHGTHVAATTAAVADNGIGIAGVAPGAEIMAVRVLDGDGSGSTADVAAGIAYAADHGADVINLSLGSPAGAGDQLMEDAIAGATGAVVVAAAGNEGADNDVEPESPCVLPQARIICVAALREGGSLAGFSNYGANSVDLAAPGVAIVSAKPDYAQLFAEDFEAVPDLVGWTTEAVSGGVEWGVEEAPNGDRLASDSPNANYGSAEPEGFAESFLFTDDPVNLEAQRGCRVHFNTLYDIEPEFDVFFAGAYTSDDSELHGEGFDGLSPGFPSFTREEVSLSPLDGRDDVHPLFAVGSDEIEEFDGAYVDDVRLICRDDSYVDAIVPVFNYDDPSSGNYVRFSGTSMAAPHVAGVVALVRAASGVAPLQAVDAVLAGTSAQPSVNPVRPTRTDGIADACLAIAVATGGDPAEACPSSVPNEWSPAPPPIPVAPVVLAPGAEPLPQDRTAPRTFFLKRPGRIVRTGGRRARVTFRVGSDEPGSSFLCKVDRTPRRACAARFTRRFGLGRHVVRVMARDAAGNVDPTPAVHRFSVRPRGT